MTREPRRPIAPARKSPEQLRADLERRRSNAAGRHRDRRLRRTSRRADRQNSIRESFG